MSAQREDVTELAGLETPKLGPTGRPLREFPVPKKLRSHGPARIIALCNQKGGVGKTTTSINLGATLAEYGRKVLAIDFDPQGALSAGLGVQAHEVTTIYDLLLGAERDVAAAILPTGIENLDIIPANIDLSAAEVHLVNEVAREQILARVLRQVTDRYDVILIDCQPSLGLLTVNALTAAHGVVIPLECEYFALRGVALLVETIEKVRDRLNPAITLDGILATMYDPRTLHSREVLQRVVEAFGDQVLETVISRTVKFPDASVAAAPVTTFAPERSRSRRRRPGARILPRARQLQRALRPAALAHREARTRHHRGRAQRRDRRVHLLPARPRLRGGARPGQRIPRGRGDPARPEGGRPTAAG